jgi:alkylation response protein AidB-like acyl-CoA dehydrogenase
MPPLLTESHQTKRDEFRAFAATELRPCAAQWDREQRPPDGVVAKLGSAGYLGGLIPREHGGQGWDAVTFGLLNDALGRESSAVTGLVTVQTMVSSALVKWGSPAQKAEWLPLLASGERIAAFAITEPGAGSALRSMTTQFTQEADDRCLVLNGRKRWITWGQRADVFLVFGMLGQQSVACLVPRDAPGLAVEPITDLMGFRAAGLAQLEFRDVALPRSSMVGRAGFALSHVASVGLHYGRMSTACSALGLLRGCLEESVAYAVKRRVGEKSVGDLGMIRSLIARMGTDLEAGSLLCHNACVAEDDHRSEVFEQILMAKYFTSRAAVRGASDAVQIQGAAGCHDSSPVARYYRDAKIMEIIEGTTQIHEDMLGKIFLAKTGGVGRDTSR